MITIIWGIPVEGYDQQGKRPGTESLHSTKHIRANSDEMARELSKKGLGGKPEASYLQKHLNNFNNFEKSSAYKGVKQGNVIHRGGGNLFIFYEHTSPVGYNNGKLTNWMRIEITSKNIHSHPADPNYVKKKLKGCN